MLRRIKGISSTDFLVGCGSKVPALRAKFDRNAGKADADSLAQVCSHCGLRCGTGDGFRAFTNFGAIPAPRAARMIRPLRSPRVAPWRRSKK